MLFYLEVMQYRLLGRIQRWAHAENICEKYLKTDSELRIELLLQNAGLVEEIELQLRSQSPRSIRNRSTTGGLPRNLFDPAAEIVKDYLRLECYPGFTWSSIYTEMAKEASTGLSSSSGSTVPSDANAMGIRTIETMGKSPLFVYKMKELLESKGIVYLFMVYLSQKRNHADFALYMGITTLLTETSVCSKKLAIFLYRTYISSYAPIPSQSVPQNLREAIYICINSLGQVNDSGDEDHEDELEDGVVILSPQSKDKERIAELKTLFKKVLDRLLQTLQSGHFQLFMESDMYRSCSNSNRAKGDSMMTSAVCNSMVASGIVVYPRFNKHNKSSNSNSNTFSIAHSFIFQQQRRKMEGVETSELEFKLLQSYRGKGEEGCYTHQQSNITETFSRIVPYLSPSGMDSFTETSQPLAYNFVIHTMDTTDGIPLYCACLIICGRSKKDRSRIVPFGICITSRSAVIVSLRYQLEKIFKALGLSEQGIADGQKWDFASIPSLHNPLVLSKNLHSRIQGLPSIDFSFQQLFTCLEIDDIVDIFLLLLLERRVLFISSYYSVLTIVAESFKALLFPLEWNHVYIPILPKSDIQRVLVDEADCRPYIVGIHSSYAYQKGFPILQKVCIVDLDRGIIRGMDKHPIQTSEASMELMYNLNDILFPNIIHSDGIHMTEMKIMSLEKAQVYPTGDLRSCFIYFMMRLIHAVRRFCIPLEAPIQEESIVLFDEKAFLASHHSGEINTFMQKFVHTSSFIEYIGKSCCIDDFKPMTSEIGL